MWSCSKLEVTWGAAALLLMALIAGAGEVLPLVALSALCHELGHLTALKLVGAKVEQIRLTAFGAEIRADTRYLSYGREIFCTLAGPAVNLFLAVVLARVTGDYLMAGANLFLGVFNLLPLPSLDGGRALYLMVCWASDPLLADSVCRWVGLVCGGILTAAALSLVLIHRTGLFLLVGGLGAFIPQLPLAKRKQSG